MHDFYIVTEQLFYKLSLKDYYDVNVGVTSVILLTNLRESNIATEVKRHK